MASKQGITAALKTLSANHRCSREWVTDNLPMWYKGLIHYEDSQLAQATADWSLKKGKAPTLHDMLTFIKSRPGFEAAIGPSGCPHCDQTGWRELARHFVDKNGKASVFNAVAPCDCDKGRLFQEKNNLPSYTDVVDRWNKLGSSKVFYTSERLPHLRCEHRYTEDHMKWLKSRAEQEAAKPAWRNPDGWTPVG